MSVRSANCVPLVTMSSIAQTNPLLALPPELRNTIYELMIDISLPAASARWTDQHRHLLNNHRAPLGYALCLGLAHICQLIRADVKLLLLAKAKEHEAWSWEQSRAGGVRGALIDPAHLHAVHASRFFDMVEILFAEKYAARRAEVWGKQ